MKLLNNIHRHGLIVILTYFPIKLYFSQWGKEMDNRIYQKISLKPTGKHLNSNFGAGLLHNNKILNNERHKTS